MLNYQFVSNEAENDHGLPKYFFLSPFLLLFVLFYFFIFIFVTIFHNFLEKASTPQHSPGLFVSFELRYFPSDATEWRPTTTSSHTTF